MREDQKLTFHLPVYIPHFTGTFASGETSVESNGTVEPPPPSNLPEDDWEPDGPGLSNFFKKQFNLEFFFTGQLAYENKNFFLRLDSYIGHIGGSVRWRSTNDELFQLSVKAVLPRMISGYKVFERINERGTQKWSIQPYWGMRAASLRFQSKTHENLNDELAIISPLLFEPIIGVKVPIVLRRWKISTLVDIGSFGIKNRWSYLGQLFVSYKVSSFFGVKFGWTEMGGSKKRYFDAVTFKFRMRGPTFGFGFYL